MWLMLLGVPLVAQQLQVATIPYETVVERLQRIERGDNEARLAGYGSIYANEPSYRPELDEGSDGVACEPWRGSRGWSRGRP